MLSIDVLCVWVQFRFRFHSNAKAHMSSSYQNWSVYLHICGLTNNHSDCETLHKNSRSSNGMMTVSKKSRKLYTDKFYTNLKICSFIKFFSFPRTLSWKLYLDVFKNIFRSSTFSFTNFLRVSQVSNTIFWIFRFSKFQFLELSPLKKFYTKYYPKMSCE